MAAGADSTLGRCFLEKRGGTAGGRSKPEFNYVLSETRPICGPLTGDYCLCIQCGPNESML